MSAQLSFYSPISDRRATLSGKKYRGTTTALVAALHLAAVYALISNTALLPRVTANRTDGLVSVSLYETPRHTASNSRTATDAQPDTSSIAAEKSASPRRLGPSIASPPPPQTAGGQPSDATPAGSAAPSEQTDASSSELAIDYQKTLFGHIQPYLRYPDAARVDHARGIVDVEFSVDRSGTVLGAWIKQSSGSTALDHEAIAAVVRAQPLPPIPYPLPAPLNVEWPVTFNSTY